MVSEAFSAHLQVVFGDHSSSVGADSALFGVFSVVSGVGHVKLVWHSQRFINPI